MRGKRNPQAAMPALADVEERVPRDHPIRTIKALAGEALPRLSPEFDRMDAQVGRAPAPAAGASPEGIAADQPVLGAQRASVLRGARRQPAVPLVRGHEPDGADLRPDGIHEELPPRAGAQEWTGALRRGGAGGGAVGSALERALQRGRDAARSGGEHQALQAARRGAVAERR